MPDRDKQLSAALDKAGIDPATIRALDPQFATDVAVVSVAGSQALEVCRELRARFARTGRWPVILGDDESLEVFHEILELSEGDSRDKLLEKARKLDVAQWLADRLSPTPNLYNAPHEEWPEDAAPDTEVVSVLDPLTQEPLEQVYVGLVPVEHPWQVPVVLKWGNWNNCPRPEVHAAFLKHWEKQYGAIPVSFTSDVIELFIERPPADREAALALAAEQFVYCTDIVEQGTQSIERLAAGLLGGTVWFFWWD